jgi:hypothetical protein
LEACASSHTAAGAAGAAGAVGTAGTREAGVVVEVVTVDWEAGAVAVPPTRPGRAGTGLGAGDDWVEVAGGAGSAGRAGWAGGAGGAGVEDGGAIGLRSTSGWSRLSAVIGPGSSGSGTGDFPVTAPRIIDIMPKSATPAVARAVPPDTSAWATPIPAPTLGIPT